MTLKQKAFVKKYLTLKGNGTEAVLRVYKVSSRNSAAVIASQNLSRERIRREVDEAFDRMLDDMYPTHP